MSDDGEEGPGRGKKFRIKTVEKAGVIAEETAAKIEHQRHMCQALAHFGLERPKTPSDVCDFGGYRDLRPEMPLFPGRRSRSSLAATQ